MRLSGIASGMDTDGMIQEMMKAERVKVDRVSQQKQIAEWRQETYNDLNKDLANFILKAKEDLGLMTKNSTGTIHNSSYKNATWVKEAIASSESDLTATASSDSMNGTHTITMEKLAKGVSGVSEGKITKAGGSNGSLAKQIDGLDLDKDKFMKFTVGGPDGEVTFIIGNDSEPAKMGEDGEVITKAKDSNNKGLDTDRVNNIVRINKSLDKVSLKDIANTISNASVNKIKEDKDGKKTVTSSSPLGIQASYDGGLDKFLMKTRGEGEGAALSFKGVGDNGEALVKALGLDFGDSIKNSMDLKDGVSFGGKNISAESSEHIDYWEKGNKNIFDRLEIDKNEVDEFEFDINGTQIKINKSDSMANIVTKINESAIKDEVKASFDKGKFKLEVTDGKELKISSSGKDDSQLASKKFLESLKLNVSTGDKGGVTQDGKHRGTNAILGSYKVDGVEMAGPNDKIEYKSNSFTINGVNFNAKAEGVESSVTINTNTDEIFDKISEFVEEYNKIIDKMNSLVGEKEYRNFKPLSKDEKEAMSDKEVELWEEKAKSGMLKGDEIVSRNIQRVRADLYESVEGVTGSFNHITNIGISTEKYVSGSAGGKLVIDEVALRKSIEKDAGGVMDLLFKQPTGDLNADDSTLTPQQLKDKRSQSGIVTRVFDNLSSGMKNIVDKSGLGDSGDIIRRVRGRITSDFAIGGSKSRIDKQMNDYDKKIADLEKYLKSKEDSYYRQFTAMEKAMQKANSQMGWLEQQFGGGM